MKVTALGATAMMYGTTLKDDALDRAHMVSFIVGEHLKAHPFIASHPDLVDICVRIGLELDDLYRAIGKINELNTTD